MAAGDIYDLNRAFERVARARAHRYTYLRTAASGLLRLPSVPLFEYFIYLYVYCATGSVCIHVHICTVTSHDDHIAYYIIVILIKVFFFFFLYTSQHTVFVRLVKHTSKRIVIFFSLLPLLYYLLLTAADCAHTLCCIYIDWFLPAYCLTRLLNSSLCIEALRSTLHTTRCAIGTVYHCTGTMHYVLYIVSYLGTCTRAQAMHDNGDENA